MRSSWQLLTCALLMAVLSGIACAADVIVASPPPAARVEVIGVRPSPAHVWVGGHWTWRGKWVWDGGRWVVPAYRNATWVPGHWDRRGHGWVWVPGHWRR